MNTDKVLVDKIVDHLESLMKRRAAKCDARRDIFLDGTDFTKALLAKNVPVALFPPRREIEEELKKRNPQCSTGFEDAIRMEDPQDDWIPPWAFRCSCEKVKGKEEIR